MKDLDPVVKKETLHILYGTVAIGAVVQLVYILVGHWQLPVLLGGLLGGCWAVFNFLMMGLTVQKCVGLSQSEANARWKSSYSLRTLLTVAVVAVSILVPWFNWVPAVAAVFSPRITIAVMSIFRKEYGKPVENPLPVPEEEEDEQDDELERLLDKVYGAKVHYDIDDPKAKESQANPAPAAERKE